MKGTIAACMKELIVEKFGAEPWERICKKTDVSASKVIPLSIDIPDETIIRLMTNACDELDLSITDLADAFGDYWVNDFAPRVYKSVYREFTSFKDFFVGVDKLHIRITKEIENARPTPIRLQLHRRPHRRSQLQVAQESSRRVHRSRKRARQAILSAAIDRQARWNPNPRDASLIGPIALNMPHAPFELGFAPGL